MAQHFKSKNVDVYAIRYSINCYRVVKMKTHYKID
ncbi:hypothetical protein KP719_05595 [Staphylococcus aureus]|nr:hypothetical protein KP719_05595 [Staphylococcus aureus]